MFVFRECSFQLLHLLSSFLFWVLTCICMPLPPWVDSSICRCKLCFSHQVFFGLGSLRFVCVRFGVPVLVVFCVRFGVRFWRLLLGLRPLNSSRCLLFSRRLALMVASFHMLLAAYGGDLYNFPHAVPLIGLNRFFPQTMLAFEGFLLVLYRIRSVRQDFRLSGTHPRYLAKELDLPSKISSCRAPTQGT